MRAVMVSWWKVENEHCEDKEDSSTGYDWKLQKKINI